MGLAFSSHFPLTFLIFPPAIWAAVRFSRLGAATAVVIVSSIAIAATVCGEGPYVPSLSVTGSLIALQTPNGRVAPIALVLGGGDRPGASRPQRARAPDGRPGSAGRGEDRRVAGEQPGQDGVLSRVSHELRTPLTAIIGYADLLLLDETREPQLAKLDALTRAPEPPLALVQDILGISLIDSGRQLFTSSRCRCEPWSPRRLARRHRGTAAGHRQQDDPCRGIDGVRQRGPPPAAPGVINLLTNAIKYSPVDGAVSIRIRPVTGARTHRSRPFG